MSSIPQKSQILVVGGGPSGSYAASALAREGFQVTLLESSKFPRYHIGESLLPTTRAFLQFIDADAKIAAHGFTRKPGAAFKFTQHKREGYTDFDTFLQNHGAWNVVRSEFDELLLRHASGSGVAVFEDTKVTSLEFENGNTAGRPVSAAYEHKPAGAPATTGTIHFDYLVDASGRAGLMSQRYLKNRKFNKSLNNVACWGYWKGCNRYEPGTRRENAVWVEALQDETGWAWFIPLHDGTVSVGVVQDQADAANTKRALRERTGDCTLTDYYLDEMKAAPGVLKYIGNGKLVLTGKDGGAHVKQAADFSYSAETYSGPHYRLVGDASAFIDPFFSSGVHLAFSGALSAAATISSSIRGVASEEACNKWHDAKVGTAYTRFLFVVLGAYKQMRAQQVDVLSDIDEDNFDRAFDLIRPIIQGTADVGKVLTENEVQKTMDFVKNVLAPTDPVMQAAVKERDPALFGAEGFVDVDQIADEDAKHVMSKVNARKAVAGIYDTRTNFASEVINGWTVNLERGKLNMVAAA